MPQFLATAAIRYTYAYDDGDTLKYIETHVIEADDEKQARAAILYHYKMESSKPEGGNGYGPEFTAHTYKVKELRITPFLLAADVLARTRHGS